jgi:hypothetical protein
VDDRYDPGAPADLERVRPSLGGGAFPHPPVLPVVAVLTLFIGLSIGFGLAPRAGDGSAQSSGPTTSLPPLRSPGLTEPAPSDTSYPIICWGDGGACGPFILVTPPPVVTTTAPPNGVTVMQAIAAAEDTYGIPESDIVDVRLVDNSDYYTDPLRSDLWVWEIVVRGPGEVPCADSSDYFTYTHEEPGATAFISRMVIADPCHDDMDVVVVDYLTGQVLVKSTAVYP